MPNRCRPPKESGKMFECGADIKEQPDCDYYECASKSKKCVWMMKFDEFVHCGNPKAQIEALKL